MKDHKVIKYPKRLVHRKRLTATATKSTDSRAAIDKMNRRQMRAFDMIRMPDVKGQLKKLPYDEEILDNNSYRGQLDNKKNRMDYEK